MEHKNKYDLEERTAKFALNTIDLMKKLPLNPINKRMIEQCVAAAGSVGANYCEATEAESRKDFIHKIGICKKEVKETRHWLNLLDHANSEFFDEFQVLLKESQELLLIFSKISRSSKASV